MQKRTLIEEVYHLPLLELILKAACVHRAHHGLGEVELCSLHSIKTGGCREDCKYCAQSSHYKTGVKAEKLQDIDEVLERARGAQAMGATRFCMGASGTRPHGGKEFEKILEMVRGVSSLGLEPCVTLGMIEEEEAKRLKGAGCHSYNHNLDTSERFYQEVVTTRSYADRLKTIQNIQKAGLHLCSGAILGMGETDDDRIDLIDTLSSFDPHPASVPINTLVAIPGTPFEDRPEVPIWDVVRMVATCRIFLPKSRIRLSGGRFRMGDAEQALCFLAGVNSLHTQGALLTTKTHSIERDLELLEALGLRRKEPRGHG